MNNQFFKDIITGLSSNPKYIPSKYFYDEKGDKLFQQIMNLKEYYLTRSEHEILTSYKSELHHMFMENCRGFNLIEFGTGDAYKTKVLLNHFLKKKTDFIFSPVDISASILKDLKIKLEKEFPLLKIDTVVAEYFDALDIINKRNCDKKVILFLGSNIGNFDNDLTIRFLSSVRNRLNKNDIMMIGFDLQKDPEIILNAYNDKKGITRDFNLNLLDRINRELGADFNITNFSHYPTYDPLTGEARSFLISKTEQEVQLNGETNKVRFDAGEFIYTETSRKYNIKQINKLAEKSGFTVKKNFFDNKQYFVDSVWYVM